MEEIGDLIYTHRKRMKLSQQAFGDRFEVSSPAIFKFEHKHLFPSMALWMRIAKEIGINEEEAMLTWIKSRLPENFKHLVKLDKAMLDHSKYYQKADIPDYATIEDRQTLRAVVLQSNDIPEGLKDLIGDDDFWIVFKPTGQEIYALVQKYGMFNFAGKNEFADALRVLRKFLAVENS